MANKETARDKEISLRRYRERKTILTLDLGTKMGWAVSEDGKYLSSGKEDVTRFKLQGERYWRNQMSLAGIIGHYNPSFIGYEKVENHAGNYAAHAYGAYKSILLVEAHVLKIPVIPMGVGEIKKFITGKGNADKQMVIDAVNKLGHNITDDNEADAVAMLYLQLSLMEK